MSLSTHDSLRIAPDVRLGERVQMFSFVNLYGCVVGDDTRIGAFVEIQRGATIGARCKISSHTFVCEGVHIGDEVFVGHGVMFVNDRFPRAVTAGGQPKSSEDWVCETTVVENGASIGSGCTILGGVTIGRHAMIGAGSVVTRDVAPRTVVAGNPARFIRELPANGAESPTAPPAIA